MTTRHIRVPATEKHARPGTALLPRLQEMLYEFHALGHFEEARPHILWLMEIAEAEQRTIRPPASA